MTNATKSVQSVPKRPKRKLKNFPMLLNLRHLSYRLAHTILSQFMRLFVWIPFVNSKIVRRFVFDSAPKNTLLLSAGQRETYVVSSQDEYVGRAIFVSGEFEFEKFEKVVDILGTKWPRSLLIDVGANIGSICIPAVSRGFFQKAIAIEPEPFNFNILSSNIYLNCLAGRILAHNLALGCVEKEELVLGLSASNYGDHRIIVAAEGRDAAEDRRNIITVSSDTFDNVVGDIPHTGTLIWMDTQGFEGYILSGAQAALKWQPKLVIEFWPYGMVRCGSYPPLKESIINAGYKVFYDLENGDYAIPLSADSLDELYERIGQKGKSTDLLIL